jgi:hypothetical protein
VLKPLPMRPAARGPLAAHPAKGPMKRRLARMAVTVLCMWLFAAAVLAQGSGSTGYGWCTICGTDVYLPGHTHDSGSSSGSSYQGGGGGNLFRSFGEALGRTLRNRRTSGPVATGEEQAVRGAAARFAEQSKRTPKSRSAIAQANSARADAEKAGKRGAPGSGFDTSGRGSAPSEKDIDSSGFDTLRQRIAKENADRRAALARAEKAKMDSRTSASQTRSNGGKSKPKLTFDGCNCDGIGCRCIWDSCGKRGAAKCGCGGVDCSCRSLRCPKFVVTAGCSGFIVSKTDGKKHCLRAGR